ncbi:uncharacterized protein BYT42DRAFT_594529 [Radiomyces spectabilis]|uniref:uncharacterized protein n=1 Tax=Radiomyces spectabilis TaxID=64574 RepID=UPI00221EE2A4|nr:uncharacterized protein BYT42DRAFT_594529 [Radiomyces spectabilis]KAI8374427.1 hypothetical protein BYT42DRAFT_594529 [Radiomyces spectabilis]
MSSSPSAVSCCARFITDPWAAAKVLVPSVAIEVVLHNKVWQKCSLRHLTLYLALINTYWFASTINLSFLESPLIMHIPTMDEKQKTECGRYRFNWLNKFEIMLGVLSLDLFCVWRERILDNNGFVDRCLYQAVLVPALITGAQAAYLLPKLNERAQLVSKGAATTDDLYKDKVFPKAHRAYIGFETAKVVGLAVAGLRFGRMLTI